MRSSKLQGQVEKLHDKNYKIDDLIELYIHRVHPLELVADNLSFQNIEGIDRVFSHIVGKPFWKELRNVTWRLKESPENKYSCSHKDIDALKIIFELRHQLIHNPSSDFPVSRERILDNLNAILAVVMASDLVVGKHIKKNLDPELSSNEKISAQAKSAWMH